MAQDEMELDNFRRRYDYPKFSMNVGFYLYSKKPSEVSGEELRLIPSLKDFPLSYFKEGMKHLEEDFFVESKNQENESKDVTQIKYTIGHDGIIIVDRTIDDYFEDIGASCCEDSGDDQAFEEFDAITGLTNTKEIAKRLQDFVLKYRDGYYYAHF